jgi:hypothetical protein
MQRVSESGNKRGLEFLPEEAFVMRLLRRAFGGGNNRDSITLSAVSTIKWHKVFETAVRWNIAPMLYRLIKERPELLDAAHIPDVVFKSIEAAYIKTSVVNQTNFSALDDIVKALTAAGVQVLLLKGAHLAPFVYRDIGMRWMADIDILIKREDLEKANELFLKMDYEHPDMEPVVWDDFGKKKEVRDEAAVIEWYKTDHMHLAYGNPNVIQDLELHWGIARSASPFAIDTEGLWERAWPEELNGQTVWVLSPEDLLLHISLHDSYYHHLNLFGLRPCCDVAAILRRFSKEIDWGRLQARAREWGIEKYLYLMLRLSQELLGSDIPADLLQSKGNKRCSDQVFLRGARRLLSKEVDKPAYRGMKYPSKIHVFHPDEGFFKKIGFFLKRIPISREELASRYSLPTSSKRICLYYLVRLASLLFSYAQVYVPYFWFRLKNGRNHRADYTLDLWLKSPKSEK